jgi:NTE family protein
LTKTFGLVLGSGAARGWAHVGVIRGLEEIGLKPDVIAGCSVGALVGGAYLLGALDEFEAWARELKPLSALQSFALKVSRGGFVNTAPAFKAFEAFDRKIETLPVKFGAVACDLGTGEEVWLTEGSVLEAARASSAIPVLMHAVRRDGRWLVDGAIANPAPVSLARSLGADAIVTVDLNAVPRVLDRFNPPPPYIAKSTVIETPDGNKAAADAPPKGVQQGAPSPDPFSKTVVKLIDDTRLLVDRQIEMARARARAEPHLFETAYAVADVFQMHLARAHARVTPPDILLEPDMRDALPNAFDRADEFIAEGRRALMDRRRDIERLLG